MRGDGASQGSPNAAPVPLEGAGAFDVLSPVP